MKYFSPLMTHSSPSRAASHAIAFASDEATSGSVMAYAERIVPFNSGKSHLVFCAEVPTRSRISMLPVSGAEQLSTSDAMGFFPSSTAMYA